MTAARHGVVERPDGREHAVHQVAPGLEVGENRRDRDPRLGRDLSVPAPADTALGEHSDGARQELVAADLGGESGGAASHGVTAIALKKLACRASYH